jgi:phosphoenolpyruvate-protein kinase (PTS system EI component)
LEVGICGEHGGDPDSIEWCHIIGNNYVSCSPFRVPIARLAAAHVALKYKPAAAKAKKVAAKAKAKVVKTKAKVQKKTAAKSKKK